MNEMQLLTWVRGPGLNLAVGIFVLGVLWRLFEIYSLGRKKDLSAPRELTGASGWRTIFRRTLPAEGMLKKAGSFSDADLKSIMEKLKTDKGKASH